MFIQIKAIRKGTKPPRWRRAYLPLHITFSQLAYILEVMLELPVTDRFEFEFFQEKDRLIEASEGAFLPHSYEYTYWNAKNSCVDDWLMEKTWFTFRLRDREDQPEYRVESEKLFDDIRLGTERLSYPVMLKEVSVKEDLCWGDGTAINQKLKDSCFLKEEKPKYPSFAEVTARIQNQQGISTNPKNKSHDHLLQKSTRSLLGEISNTIKKAMSQQSDMAPIPRTVAPAVHKNQRKTGSLLEMLNSYTKADLVKAAEETGCLLRASTKSKMAFELTRHLLDPDVMRILLLELSEEELDGFEMAIDKKRFRPTEGDWEYLGGAYDLNYVAEFSDDTAEVPEDVTQIYKLICQNGYRAYHADARWLIDCLVVYALIFVTGPVKHLFRMYKQREGSQTEYECFLDLLKKIPGRYNPCQLLETRIVVKEAMEDNLYLAIEARQRDVPYYLPREKEIREFVENGYPASDPAYRKLYSFFQKDMKLKTIVSEECCRSAFQTFSGGGMLSDYMDELRERGISFSQKGQVEKLAGLVMDLNNRTRMYELRGHTPNEMRALMPVSAGMDQRPTIVPMSGLTAGILEESRTDLEKIGFGVDTGMTADSIPVLLMPGGPSGEMKTGVKKIYPNDPCPCGSGKKYKKCCGRKK